MVSHQDTSNKYTFLKASNSPVLEVGSSSDDGVLRPHQQVREDSNQHEYNVEEVVQDDTLGGVKVSRICLKGMKIGCMKTSDLMKGYTLRVFLDDPYDFENAMSTWHLESWLKFINEVMQFLEKNILSLLTP
ncbi:hypothetical protein L1887_15841 [Cichorium endivia]|nr:hypothetical protein L1887_15841 [Cichorium endivia]